ncbi:hypothetical protein IP69_04655 [Bosea sp. AAP35]|nr:hypothetical protein IP69_04655 [Bosea sp. AAP35]
MLGIRLKFEAGYLINTSRPGWFTVTTQKTRENCEQMAWPRRKWREAYSLAITIEERLRVGNLWRPSEPSAHLPRG